MAESRTSRAGLEDHEVEEFEESNFVRHMMYDQTAPKWRQYAAIVIGNPTIGRLIAYELRVALLGSMQGAAGLFLRQKFYRTMFRKVGRNVVIGRDVVIRHGDKISLGDNVVLDDGCLLDGRGAGDEGVVIGDNTIIGRRATIQSKIGFLRIGSNVNIGTDTSITSQGGLQIGDWAQIAGGCKISGGRFKLEPEMPNGVPFKRLSTGPVFIGECCFIGPSVTITDGANIGRFSVIGSGAIVMSVIPEYSVFMPRPGMFMGSTIKKAAEPAPAPRSPQAATPGTRLPRSLESSPK